MSSHPNEGVTTPAEVVRRVRARLRRVLDALSQPATPIQRVATYALVALVTCWAFAEYTRIAGAPVFPVDDAYITLHNAMALRDGHDPNFGGSSPLTGATSAIHLVLVRALLLVASPAWALYVAAWIGVVAYTQGLARVAFERGGTALHAALLVAAGVFVAGVQHQLLNGLETGLAMAAIVWGFALASEAAPRHRWMLPVLCAQMPFLRPELIALAPAMLLVRASNTRIDRATIRRSALDFAVLVAAAMPWMLWYAASTGSPIPSTIGAKQAFFAEGCLPTSLRSDWTLGALATFSTTLGWFSRAALLLAFTRLGWAGGAFGAVLIGAYYTRFPGALTHYDQRYLYVLVPILLYACASCLAHRVFIVRALACILLIVGIDEGHQAFRGRFEMHMQKRGFTANELRPLAEWCEQSIPHDATVLIHDAGYLSYATDLQLIDIVGLKTPSSTRYHAEYTATSCGAMRGEAVHRIASTNHADYLVVLREWDRLFRFTAPLRAHGWTLDEVRHVGDPGSEAHYDVYRLTPPAAP